jgi:hypothetical protein
VADLLVRRSRANAEAWLGEIEGIDLTLQFLRQARKDSAPAPAIDLGMPNPVGQGGLTRTTANRAPATIRAERGRNHRRPANLFLPARPHPALPVNGVEGQPRTATRHVGARALR